MPRMEQNLRAAHIACVNQDSFRSPENALWKTDSAENAHSRNTRAHIPHEIEYNLDGYRIIISSAT